MIFFTANLSLVVVDVVTRGAAETEKATVSLVVTHNGSIAAVSSVGEPGVVNFITTLKKQEVMDYWGDRPLTDAL